MPWIRLLNFGELGVVLVTWLFIRGETLAHSRCLAGVALGDRCRGDLLKSIERDGEVVRSCLDGVKYLPGGFKSSF